MGGSSVEFKRLALESGAFKVVAGEQISDGASNVREVFLLVRK